MAWRGVAWRGVRCCAAPQPQAAIYLAEGENNDKFDTHPSTPARMFYYELAHSRWLYFLHLLASMVLLLLAAFERPAARPLLETRTRR